MTSSTDFYLSDSLLTDPERYPVLENDLATVEKHVERVAGSLREGAA